MNAFKKFLSLYLLLGSISLFAESKKIRELIFEEQQIEGKIKRPQVIMIAADTRPKFKPMMMNIATSEGDITASINPEVFEFKSNKSYFRIENIKQLDPLSK